MSIKAKLLEEINLKAKKIKEKRVDAASNKTIEAAILDFFKNIEETRKLHNGEQYDPDLLHRAKIALTERLKAFDRKVKISIDWSTPPNQITSPEDPIRGVTVWWSKEYIAYNNCEQSLYFDITQILLL
jgi:hypothetical protein